jgi:hypothetical protein
MRNDGGLIRHASHRLSEDGAAESSAPWRSFEVNAYDHTQRAPLHWLLYPPAGFLLAMGWLNRGQGVFAVVLFGAAALMLALAFSFQQLTVRDEGSWLAIRYGPLPVFRTRISYAEISSVERGRSSWIDGWGIHWIPGRGYTYNLWGFECVKLELRGRTVRIGTDDAEELIAFLKTKMPQKA